MSDDNQIILNKVIKMHDKIKDELKNVPFDKGLPIIRNEAWKIADEHNTTGAEILKIYFDYVSSHEVS